MDTGFFQYIFDEEKIEAHVTLNYRVCLVAHNQALDGLYTQFSKDIARISYGKKIVIVETYRSELEQIWKVIKSQKTPFSVRVRIGEGAPNWRGLSVTLPSNKRLVAHLTLSHPVENLSQNTVRQFRLVVKRKLAELDEDREPSLAQYEGFLRRAKSKGGPYAEDLAQGPALDRDHPLRIVTSERVGEILIVCSSFKIFHQHDPREILHEKLMTTSLLGSMTMPLDLCFDRLLEQIQDELVGPASLGLQLPFVGLAAFRIEVPHEALKNRKDGWYYPLIRQVVGINEGTQGTSPKEIGENLKMLREEQVAWGLAACKHMGFIREKKSGQYFLNKNRIAPDHVISGMPQEDYLKFLLLLAEVSLERIPSKKREFNACTFAGTLEQTELVRGELKRFVASRKFKFAPTLGDGVYLLSFQFFPYTLSEYESRLEPKERPKGPSVLSTEWITTMLYDLVGLTNFKDNHDWILRHLYFPITADQYEAAISQLTRIGLLEKDNDNGKLVRKHSSISTAESNGSAKISQFHKSILALSREALAFLPAQRKEFYGELIAINLTEYKELVADLREIAKKTLSDSDKSVSPTQVFQFNSQLFPLKHWST